MISADLCRRRANRLLRRAATVKDPEARSACQAEARSWMLMARMAKWDEFFGGDEPGFTILN